MVVLSSLARRGSGTARTDGLSRSSGARDARTHSLTGRSTDSCTHAGFSFGGDSDIIFYLRPLLMVYGVFSYMYVLKSNVTIIMCRSHLYYRLSLLHIFILRHRTPVASHRRRHSRGSWGRLRAVSAEDYLDERPASPARFSASSSWVGARSRPSSLERVESQSAPRPRLSLGRACCPSPVPRRELYQ